MCATGYNYAPHIMKTHLTIVHLTQPCAENWDNMTPNNMGRHCAACNKTVTDYSLMRDSELLKILKNQPGTNTCGSFLPHQLHRPLVDNRYKHSFVGILAQRASAILLLLQSLGATALAQQVKKNDTAAVTTRSEKAVTNNKWIKRQIRGKVIDENSKKPFAGIKVQVKGTHIFTVTNFRGVFKIDLPDTLQMDEVIIKCQTQNTTHNSYFFSQRIISKEELVSGETIIIHPAYNIPINSTRLTGMYSTSITEKGLSENHTPALRKKTYLDSIRNLIKKQ